MMSCIGDPAGGRPLLEQSVQLATQAGDDWCRIDAAQCLALSWIVQDQFDTARPVLDDMYATATRRGYTWGFPWHWLCLGWEALFQGRLADAQEFLGRSIAASDEVGLPITNGFANGFLAYLHVSCGETKSAHSLASTTLQRVLETGAGFVVGMANQMLGRTEIALGDLVAARGHLETAVDVERRSGFVYMLSWHLALLGSLERLDGNLDASRARGNEALELARRQGSDWMQAGAQRLLGRLALATGQATDAERHTHQALGRLVAKGFATDIPECLDILAAVAARQESFEEAARLLGAAAAGRARLGIIRFPPEPEFWAQTELTTRDALGHEVYDAAFTAGAALDDRFQGVSGRRPGVIV